MADDGACLAAQPREEGGTVNLGEELQPCLKRFGSMFVDTPYSALIIEGQDTPR